VKIPPYSGGQQLPDIGAGSGDVKPIDPNDLRVEVPNGGNQGSNKPTPPVGKEDDPVVMRPPGGDPAPANDGSIEIKVYNGGTKASGSEANGAKAQSMIAKEQFLMGNYRKAASLFEQAIRSGGDPISLNQKLGQSYEKMGQSGDAVQAYKRSIQAAESALSSGRGNPDQIRSAKESAEQALRNLGG
jgi:tetratricopeptide (TPR) repeat protein